MPNVPVYVTTKEFIELARRGSPSSEVQRIVREYLNKKKEEA